MRPEAVAQRVQARFRGVVWRDEARAPPAPWSGPVGALRIAHPFCVRGL